MNRDRNHKRVRTLLSVVLPSMIAGGLLFASSFGHAAAGDTQLAYWPAASDATTPRTGAVPPAPPKAPVAPKAPDPWKSPQPPVPPRPPKAAVHDVKAMVLGQLDGARAALRSNPKIPKELRDKLLTRLDTVRASLDKRLANLKITDLDQLDDEMEKMGEEIEHAMDGLDTDLEKLGEKLGEDLGKGLHIQIDGEDDDDDDDNDVPMAPDVDIDADDDDMKDAISDLEDLALKPAQRDAITKLRTDSDRSVAAARKQLDDLSAKLRTALASPATADGDVARFVDQISAQEAVIRKARILAWVQARRVLDDRQRKKVEDASKKKTK